MRSAGGCRFKQISVKDKVVSTDPPYYDNIGYADLSDFFYVWLRRSLKPSSPTSSPRSPCPRPRNWSPRPTATAARRRPSLLPRRHDAGDAPPRRAGAPGLPGHHLLRLQAVRDRRREGTASTGWETFLDAVIRAGFAISGTWPMRTEARQPHDRNRAPTPSPPASSSSAARAPPTRPTATRREFVTALKAELPVALAHLQRGNIAPVDLAQAAIGPGMAVYTRYAKVLDAEGKPLSVREALALINQTLDEALAEQEGDFDADSRWALAWFEQRASPRASTAWPSSSPRPRTPASPAWSRPASSNRSAARCGCSKPDELPADWDPATDPRLTAWEIVHHLIRVLEAAARARRRSWSPSSAPRPSRPRTGLPPLHLCERKKRAEALSYNGLVQSWPEITRLAREADSRGPRRAGGLF
jgi:putative DNA methylase